jgi:hypothetical protein
MIEILGVKRLIGIVVLLTVNILIGSSLLFYFMPQNKDLEKDFRRVGGIINAKRNDVMKIQDEFDRIQDQKLLFEDLKKMGFFDDQDRFQTQRRIEAIQQMTEVLNVTYEVREAKIEENEHAKKANHVVLNTPIKINIEALDDKDFYAFLYWVDHAFSGQTSITKIRLQRVNDINDSTLRSIGTGNPITLIRGTFEFDWRTMISSDELGTIEGSVEQ